MEASAARSRLPELAKYEVLEEIGHGGMATVYRARDRRLGREVAVKIIHPHLRDSKEVVSRFNTEARAVAKLRHPNIVEVFDVSEPDDLDQYLVVELLRGTTLRKLLQTHGRMPPEIAAAVALELLGGLAHANAMGVVHRDIKPENVLIEHRPPPSAAVSSGQSTPAPSGDRAIVKLTDFGIAKLLDAQGVTSTGQVLGSPAHMAPEQIEGGDVDARADVFGLGVLLYECMVGHLPFEGNNPAQVLRRVLDGIYPEAQAERPVVGSRWSALLDRALAHAPADRFADAGAIQAAIVEELDRLGFAQPRRELEAWLDDPEGYAAAHAGRMIDKLCALGAAERKRGDSLAAAGDYNRALAHAPDDPNLLHVVAGMNRSEARARLMRRALQALVLMVGLGALAFGVGRLVRPHPAVGPTPELASAHGGPVVPGSAAGEVASVTMASAAASVSARPRVMVPATASTHEPPKPVEREVHLDITPTMGITVTIDGAPPRAVNSGDTLTLDSKVHSLTFTCSVCTPVARDVQAGDKEETIAVKVPIKPARLIVVGDVDKTYQIDEHPELTVRVGANSIPMSSQFDPVHVKQLETGVRAPVRLEAGKQVEATF
jgi:eukaryotic-like serine/threonine-protein kinase